jgi:hypothetical protein
MIKFLSDLSANLTWLKDKGDNFKYVPCSVVCTVKSILLHDYRVRCEATPGKQVLLAMDIRGVFCAIRAEII